jgi:AcrR family transcriptional regulator
MRRLAMSDKAPRRTAHQLAHLPSQSLPDGTKGRILKAALRLFIEHGFAGASIRDLARELELQPTALYAHFPSKEHVLAELARIGFEAHYDALRRATLGVGSDATDQIRAWVRAHVIFHAAYPMLAVLIHEQMHLLSPELAGPSHVLRQQSERLLYDIVARGVTHGGFHPPHEFVAAAAIGAMGMRVAHWYHADFELSPEQIADAQAELAVRMLR